MKKIFSLLAAVLMAGSMMAQFDTWSVVGSKAIMNGTADWAIAETANDMATEDGVTYTLTVTGKTLEVGTTYEYKYAKGHAWSNGEFPSQNAKLTVTETAVYDIVYTANVSAKTHSAVATKTGTAGEITHTYSIAGSSADLFGAAWSQTATATEMTKGEDGIYSWTKENVELAAATIEYKVVVDHAWGEAYPSQNATLVIAEAGTYNVVITFNPANKAVNATATKAGVEPGPGPEPEPEINYWLIGTAAENGWDQTAAMPMEGDSIVRSLTAGTYEFKVLVAEGSWDGALGFGSVNAECSSEGYEDNGGNVKVTLNADGDLKVKIVDGQICVVGSFGEAVITVYTIAGDAALMGDNWAPAAVANDMTENEGTWTLVKTDVELTADSYEYKVVGNHTWGVADFPAQGNNTLIIAEDATYDVTFTWVPAENSLTANAVKKGTPTGVDNAEMGGLKKMIQNGQLVIVREGVRYNAQGAQF